MTAEIRILAATVREEVGEFTAGEVKGMFKSILASAEEDFGVPVLKEAGEREIPICASCS